MSGNRTKIQRDTQIKIVGDVVNDNVDKKLKNNDENKDEDATITG